MRTRGLARGPRGLSTLLMAVAAVAAACTSDLPIEAPEPLYGEEPVNYPLEMWDQGVEGRAVLRVLVSDKGTVDEVEVTKSSGMPELDSAAVKGIRETRFRPARQGKKRVAAWATVPVDFTQRPVRSRVGAR